MDVGGFQQLGQLLGSGEGRIEFAAAEPEDFELGVGALGVIEQGFVAGIEVGGNRRAVGRDGAEQVEMGEADGDGLPPPMERPTIACFSRAGAMR